MKNGDLALPDRHLMELINGEERLLFGEDVHAYAQVAEAVQFPELDSEALQAYCPQRRIMQLPAIGGEPTMILSSAGQPALTLP